MPSTRWIALIACLAVVAAARAEVMQPAVHCES